MATSEFVKNAGLSEREGAFQEMLVQSAEKAGVEAVEAANGGDRGGIEDHGLSLIVDIVQQLVDYVKYQRRLAP
jgi:hypothetical protein